MGSLLEYAITGPYRFRGKYESTGLGQGCGVGLLTVTLALSTVPRRPYTGSVQSHWAGGDGGRVSLAPPPSTHRPCLPRGPHALQ